MRKLISFIGLLFFSSMGFSQVSWQYSAVKTGEGIYELHLKAAIDKPWHLYSQFTPSGGPIPSEVVFEKNPVISIEGKPKELGESLRKHEKVFGVDVVYFDNGVEFVQTIKLKGKVQTTIKGSVKYMVCNDTECKPPKTESFSIKIN